MKVIYSPQALRDIDGILNYISDRSPQGAHSLSRANEYTIHMCALKPGSRPKTDEPNLFRRPLGKYPYAIFDRACADTETFEIAHVIHGARIKDVSKLPKEE